VQHLDFAMAGRFNVETLREKLGALTEAVGFELADLRTPVVGGRFTLRVFIHSPEGVTLDDCAFVSQKLSDLLDTEDLIESRYTLEVSSLGLDRPLITPKDFSRRIGERVKVTFKRNGKVEMVEGILIRSDESDLTINLGDETVTIPVHTNPRGEIII
jgi:ribosome maturation factor RimP